MTTLTQAAPSTFSLAGSLLEQVLDAAPVADSRLSSLLEGITVAEPAVAEPPVTEAAAVASTFAVGNRVNWAGKVYFVRWAGVKNGEARLGLSFYMTGRIPFWTAEANVSAAEGAVTAPVVKPQEPELEGPITVGCTVTYRSKNGRLGRYYVSKTRNGCAFLRFCASKSEGFWVNMKNCRLVAKADSDAQPAGWVCVCGDGWCKVGPFVQKV